MEIIAYSEYYPGLMSRIIEMQAKYYHKFWSFGLEYEINVAKELALFMSQYTPGKDILLYALTEEKVIGSIIINGSELHSGEAQLRWFIMDDDYIGYGVGAMLMNKALEFCEKQNFKKIFLITFKGLGMAKNLYERHGFELKHEKETHQWGPPVTEQYYERVNTTDFIV